MRRFVLVLVVLFALMAPVLQPRTTEANHQYLAWNEDGAPFATFGPNEYVTIYDGAMEFMCDAFFPTTDIYVMSGVPTAGSALSDVLGAPNTVFGATGGYFSETIAITLPSGNLGPGVYTVVYDECQDGKLTDSDAVFPNAFEVVIPANVPPIDPAIVNLKLDALVKAEEAQNMYVSFQILDQLEKLEVVLYCLTSGAAVCVVEFAADWLADELKEHALADSMKDKAKDAMADNVKHWQAIADDPPDPAFQQHTTLDPVLHLDPQTTDPLLQTEIAAGNAIATEAAVAEALLRAMERYQGADLAGDGDWALVHAREMRLYAGLLANQVAQSSLALSELSSALAADSRDFDALAAYIDPQYDRIAASGFSAEEEQALLNQGATAAELDALKAQIATIDVGGFTEANMLTDINDLMAANDAAITSLNELVSNMDSIIAGLEADPGVGDQAPIADAGGPYDGAEGSAITFIGSGSISPSPITTYEWDLDRDGAFDDATGEVVSHTYNTAFTGVIGLRVTNEASLSSIAYVPVAIHDANSAPSVVDFSPTNPGPELIVGSTQAFSVNASDPDGDMVAVEWRVDGAAAGSGKAFSYTPATADLGVHLIEAVATDDSPLGGSVRQTWLAYVLLPDADGDGWHANTDCDDTDAFVNPNMTEMVGNGVDDDCDPATSDAGSPPTADFTTTPTIAGPGSPLHFTDTSMDPNSDISGWAWDFNNDGTIDSSLQNPSHTYANTGSFDVTLTVSDAQGNSDSVVKTIQVSDAPNSAPVLGPPCDPSVTSGVHLVGAQVYVSAADGSNSLWPEYQYSTNSATGHLPLPINDDSDGLAISFPLNDCANTFDFSVTQSYDPGAYAGLNVFFSPDSTSYNPPHAGAGIAGHLAAVAPTDESGAFFTPATGTNVQSYETSNYSVSTTSYSGATTYTVGNRTLWLTQYAVNRTPTGSFTVFVSNSDSSLIGDQVVDEATTLTVPIFAFDPDGDQLVLSATGLPAFATFVDNGDGTASLTIAPGFSDGGTYPDVTISVTDGMLIDSQTFQIIVNEAAGVDAGPDQSTTEGSAVNLTAASFVDLDPTVSHSASINWGDGTMEAADVTESNGAGGISGSHVYADDGVYTVEVCVSDGASVIDCDALVVTVANVAPVVASNQDNTDDLIVNGGFDTDANGWTSANLDSAGGWKSSGGNPGGMFVINQAGQLATDPMISQVVSNLVPGYTYQVSGDYASYAPSFGNPNKPDAFGVLLDGAEILALPRPVDVYWGAFTASFTATSTQHTITFVAERHGDDSSFQIDNISLIGNSSSEGEWIVDVDGKRVEIEVGFSDLGAIDTHIASIDWGDDVTTAGLVTEAFGEGTVAGSHTYALAGTYTVTVTVIDDDGASDTDAFTVTVNDINQPPDLVGVSDQALAEGSTLVMGVASTDPDDDPVTLSATGLPAFATFTDHGNGLGSMSIAPGFNHAGNYPDITITASAGTLSTSNSFSITVTDVVNRPPVANAGSDQTVSETASVTLDALASSDPDGNALSLSWQVLHAVGPEITLSSPTSATPNFNTFDDGVYVFRLTVDDGNGRTHTDDVAIVVGNLPPEITSVANDGPASIGENVTITVAATDPAGDNDPLTYRFDCDGNGAFERIAGVCSYHIDGAYLVGVQVIDDDGGVALGSTTVTIVSNTPPTVAAGEDVNIAEGSLFSRTGSFSDPDPDTWTVTVDYGDGSGVQPLALNADKTFTLEHTYADNGVYTVTVTVDDGQGGIGTDTVDVTVTNVAPSVDAITAPADPVAVNTAITASAAFSDVGITDTHTATWDWGDGTSSAGTVAESNGSGSVTDSHTYTAAGVYTLALTVTDDDGGSAQSMYQYVVVYDPDAGFVTGGGWIDSPAGAYTADPTLTGKASFGFVSKYKKGATVPDGQTQFQFHAAGLNFHSTVYEWLVISGPKAQYKGSGAINGAGDYGFLLTANDGQVSGGGGVDKFRIKIWDKATGNVVYDNQIGDADDGDATDAIEGGSIVIHTK